MITNVELTQMKERAEKATAGPWENFGDSRVYTIDEELTADFDYATICHGFKEESDAAFIAHAREDVPRLVAEVERLQNALESVQSDLFSIRGVDSHHDSNITGVCANIRRVLNGDDYE